MDDWIEHGPYPSDRWGVNIVVRARRHLSEAELRDVVRRWALTHPKPSPGGTLVITDLEFG